MRSWEWAHWQPGRKLTPESYSSEELDFAHNLNKLGADSLLEPHDRVLPVCPLNFGLVRPQAESPANPIWISNVWKLSGNSGSHLSHEVCGNVSRSNGRLLQSLGMKPSQYILLLGFCSFLAVRTKGIVLLFHQTTKHESDQNMFSEGKTGWGIGFVSF